MSKHLLLFFKFVFIYFWLHWAFVGLSAVAEQGLLSSCGMKLTRRAASGADTAHRSLVEQITTQAFYPFIDYTPQ